LPFQAPHRRVGPAAGRPSDGPPDGAWHGTLQGSGGWATISERQPPGRRPWRHRGARRDVVGQSDPDL